MFELQLGTTTAIGVGSSSSSSTCGGRLTSCAADGVTTVPEILFDDPSCRPVVAILCKPGVLLADLRMGRVSELDGPCKPMNLQRQEPLQWVPLGRLTKETSS
jgi:hypothetical protein